MLNLQKIREIPSKIDPKNGEYFWVCRHIPLDHRLISRTYWSRSWCRAVLASRFSSRSRRSTAIAAGGQSCRAGFRCPRWRAAALQASWKLQTVRSRLYQRRFWRPNTHFAAFFEIYKIWTFSHRSNLEILAKFRQNFAEIFAKFAKFWWNLR